MNLLLKNIDGDFQIKKKLQYSKFSLMFQTHISSDYLPGSLEGNLSPKEETELFFLSFLSSVMLWAGEQGLI